MNNYSEEKFLIEGGKKLEGKIEVKGAKNAAGALLAATLLTDKECILDNVPRVKDILNLIEILKEIGKEIKWLDEEKIQIKEKEIDVSKLDFQKFSKARISVLLIGGLLPRFKSFKVSQPGGDKIGLRPISTHLKGFEELGVKIDQDNGFYYFKREKLKGKEIVLREFSVTATENLIIASVLAEGRTVIKIAAQEPHVQNLIEMLNKMGAKIKNYFSKKPYLVLIIQHLVLLFLDYF